MKDYKYLSLLFAFFLIYLDLTYLITQKKYLVFTSLPVLILFVYFMFKAIVNNEDDDKND